jgi:hypothetical protein
VIVLFALLANILNGRVEVYDKLIPLKSATYNSRDARPGCLEGTRVALHRDLSAWAHDGASELTTLWLNGMAGTGKSAIIKTCAETMEEVQNPQSFVMR